MKCQRAEIHNIKAKQYKLGTDSRRNDHASQREPDCPRRLVMRNRGCHIYHARYLLAIGSRRSRPNAFGVIFTPGGA